MVQASKPNRTAQEAPSNADVPAPHVHMVSATTTFAPQLDLALHENGNLSKALSW